MAGGQEATRDEVAAEIVASRGGLGLPFELLLASPEVARRTASLGEYLRFHSELAADLRELASWSPPMSSAVTSSGDNTGALL